MKTILTLSLLTALVCSAQAQRTCVPRAPGGGVSITQIQESGTLDLPDLSFDIPSAEKMLKQFAAFSDSFHNPHIPKNAAMSRSENSNGKSAASTTAKVNGYEVTLSTKSNGKEMLKATDRNGKVLYDGPRDRAKNLPGPVRSILANMKVEATANKAEASVQSGKEQNSAPESPKPTSSSKLQSKRFVFQ